MTDLDIWIMYMQRYMCQEHGQMVKANNSGVKIVKIAFYKGKTMIMMSDLENRQ